MIKLEAGTECVETLTIEEKAQQHKQRGDTSQSAATHTQGRQSALINLNARTECREKERADTYEGERARGAR